MPSATSLAPISPKRFATIYSLLLGFIILFALAPIISVILSGWLASANGCMLDEGSTHPCVILGADRGELLYTMFVLGWFMFLTLPAGALAFVVWLVVLLVHRSSWRRGPAATATSTAS